MNAIIRTLRKVKKLQSQSNANANASQSEPMKQDSGLASAEPADKKLRKFQDQKPTKSFAPPQELEEKGEFVAQPLPNIMLSSNLVKEVSAEVELRRDDQRQKLGNIDNAKLLPGSHFPPPLNSPCFKDLSYDTINSYKPMPLLPNLPYPYPTYRLFSLPNGFINGKSLPETQFGRNSQWRK